MVQAYLFDLDGTLIDSEPWHKRAEIEAFARMGFEVRESDLAPFVGTTLPAMLAAFSMRFGVEITPDAFRVHSQPILTEFIHGPMEPFAGSEELLAGLGEAPRALVTSSMRWYVDEVVARFSWIGAHLPVQVCQADVVRGKPDPEPYLLACERLGVRPEVCVAFEDSTNGVRSAKAAGCRVVGVDRHGSGVLEEADWVVASWADWQSAL